MGGFDPYKVNYEILLEGEQVTNALLGLSVTTEVNRIPRARLELNYRQLERTEGNEVDLENAKGFDEVPKKVKKDFLPGKAIEIKLGRGKELKSVFTGYITRQNIEAGNNGKLLLFVDCRHQSNKMTVQKRTRFFHHDANKGQSAKENIDPVNDNDVLKHLIEKSEDYGLSLEIKNPPKKEVDYENMVQYNCSDWDFLVMRAEAMGYVCWPNEKKIEFLIPELAPKALETIELKGDILSYEAEYDETIRSAENVMVAWDPEKQEFVKTDEKNTAIEQEAKVLQTDQYFSHSGDIQSPEAKAFLKNQILRQELGLVRGTLKLKGTVKHAVADTVSITGFESIWDRDTLITGIKHTLRGGSWVTYLQCGLSNESHAEKYGLNASADQTLMPQSNTLLYGVVQQYKMSESGHELVEVELTSYNGTESDARKTIYARMTTFSAGEKGGAVFRPYPGDEVVIGFINNDPRFPVVLGSVYNAKNEPPYKWEDHETQFEVGFSINKWQLSIHEHDELLTISSPGGQSIVLDDCDQNIQMFYDDSNGITITSDGVEIDAKKITLKGMNGVEISGQKVEAKADTSMKLEGGTQLELEGKVTASLKGQITQIN